jgi:hypothetical protein
VQRGKLQFRLMAKCGGVLLRRLPMGRMSNFAV